MPSLNYEILGGNEDSAENSVFPHHYVIPSLETNLFQEHTIK